MDEDLRQQIIDRLSPIIGVQLPILQIPTKLLSAFEPSQIGTIFGNALDALLPLIHEFVEVEGIENHGLKKAEGLLKDREGYPDYKHELGPNIELKGAQIDPIDPVTKTAETRREPSSRITESVTKEILEDNDLLLVVGYQMQPVLDDDSMYALTIVDIGLFAMSEIVDARDERLIASGGFWFDESVPVIPSNLGKRKQKSTIPLDATTGFNDQKGSSGHDYSHDTNFGKLKRIPHAELQQFLARIGADYMDSWNSQWKIVEDDDEYVIRHLPRS